MTFLFVQYKQLNYITARDSFMLHLVMFSICLFILMIMCTHIGILPAMVMCSHPWETVVNWICYCHMLVFWSLFLNYFLSFSCCYPRYNSLLCLTFPSFYRERSTYLFLTRTTWVLLWTWVSFFWLLTIIPSPEACDKLLVQQIEGKRLLIIVIWIKSANLGLLLLKIN